MSIAQPSVQAIASNPALAPVLAAVRTAQARYRLFPLPDSNQAGGDVPVVVGVSGGADSLCLLYALVALAQTWPLSLHIAHLDHALRPTSADDAAFVQAVAQHFDLPFYHTRLPDNALFHDPAGLEAAARRARYTFLGQVARQVAQRASTPAAFVPVTVAVAHHQNDQAETVLMHLIGGSGLDGLGGMRWVTRLPYYPAHSHNAPRLVRPLLGVDQPTIHAALNALGVSWREDRTNQDTAHLRNQVRHEFLPMLARVNPNLHATLARTANVLAAEAERAAACNQAALAALRLEQTQARVVLDLDKLLACDLATQRGVLQAALDHLAIERRDTGADQIDAILARSRQPASGGPYPIVQGWAWTLLGAAAGRPRRLSLHRAADLPLTPDQPLLPPGVRLPLPLEGALDAGNGWRVTSRVIAPAALPPDWRAPGHPWRAFLDAARARDLVLTTAQPGMQLAPLGLGGHRRSVGDLLTDHKIAPALRPHWPVVCTQADGDVVWVCGLRASHTYRVQPTTQSIRLLEWERTPRERTPTEATV